MNFHPIKTVITQVMTEENTRSHLWNTSPHVQKTGKYLCPICSAAARVLAGNGLLKGRRYVCSGDLWQDITDGVYIDAPVVEEGNLISGKGFGHVFDFAFTVAARLLDDEAPVREHADHIYYSW